MTSKTPYYSVVIPFYNEAGNVTPLFEEVVNVMTSLDKSFEIIAVDDASKDGTFEELKTLKPLTIIRMRVNAGQSSALDAGIKRATGTVLITMDGDGQDDPRNIPDMLELLADGYDTVCAWRQGRKDSLFVRTISSGWKHLRNHLVADGVHDAGTQFRVYKREVFDDIDLYGELHRFIPALLKWRGFKVTEMKVNHRARQHGASKYTWTKVFKGFSDVIYMWFLHKYAHRPAHLFGSVGVISMIIGALIVLVMAWMRIMYDYQLSNKIWPLVGFSFFVIGIQMLTTGVIASNMLRMDSSKKYYIGEVLEQD